MKVSIIDHMVWLFMAGTCYKVLHEAHPQWDIPSLRRQGKKRFMTILRDIPSIGSYWNNSLRKNLNGGCVWLAIYEVAHQAYGDEMDEVLFERMINRSISNPMMIRMSASTNMFSRKYQERFMRQSEKDNSHSSEYNWHAEIIQGNPEEEFTLYYTSCGLCRLARKLGHQNLLPYMCRTDYIVFNAMGANLHRHKTLADGDDCCYYYFTRPGSAADKKWNEQHPEGSFISK